LEGNCDFWGLSIKGILFCAIRRKGVVYLAPYDPRYNHPPCAYNSLSAR
jgi:hypothetical protein